MSIISLLCILGSFQCLRPTNTLFTLLFFALWHGSPHNSLYLHLCKFERRGVIRIRIRSRVIRIRVRRACIRAIVRVTASSTDTETYHAERCRQLPNVAARLLCRAIIFHPPAAGGFRFRPRRVGLSMLSKFALSDFLRFRDDGVFLKIAERRGVIRSRKRSRASRIRARRARIRARVRVTASSTDTETL